MLVGPLVLKKKINRSGNAGDVAVLSSLLCYITELTGRALQQKSNLLTSPGVKAREVTCNSKHRGTNNNSSSSSTAATKHPTRFELLHSKFMNPNREPPLKRRREVGKLIVKEKQSVARGCISASIYKLDRSKEKKGKDPAEDNKKALGTERVKWTHPSGKNTVKNILRNFMAAEEKEKENSQTWQEKASKSNLPIIISKNSVLAKLKERFEQPSSLCSVTELNAPLVPKGKNSKKKDFKRRHIRKADIGGLQICTVAASCMNQPVSQYLVCTVDPLPVFHVLPALSCPLTWLKYSSEAGGSRIVSCSVDNNKQAENVLENVVVNTNGKGHDGYRTDELDTGETCSNDDVKPRGHVPENRRALGQPHSLDKDHSKSADVCEPHCTDHVKLVNKMPEIMVKHFENDRPPNKTSDNDRPQTVEPNTSNSMEYLEPSNDGPGEVASDLRHDKLNSKLNDHFTPVTGTSESYGTNNIKPASETLGGIVSDCRNTRQEGGTQILETGGSSTDNANPAQSSSTDNANPAQSSPTDDANPAQSSSADNTDQSSSIDSTNPAESSSTDNTNAAKSSATVNANPAKSSSTDTLNPVQSSSTDMLNPVQSSSTDTLNPVQSSSTDTLNPVQSSSTDMLNPVQSSSTHMLNPVQSSPTDMLNPVQSSPTDTLNPVKSSSTDTLNPVQSSSTDTLNPVQSSSTDTLNPVQSYSTDNTNNEMPKTLMADRNHETPPKRTLDVHLPQKVQASNSYCSGGDIKPGAEMEEGQHDADVNCAQMTVKREAHVTEIINPTVKIPTFLTSGKKDERREELTAQRSELLPSDNTESANETTGMRAPCKIPPNTLECDMPRKVKDKCKDIVGTEIDLANQGLAIVSDLDSSPASCERSVPAHSIPGTSEQTEEYHTVELRIADAPSPPTFRAVAATSIVCESKGLTRPPFTSAIPEDFTASNHQNSTGREHSNIIPKFAKEAATEPTETQRIPCFENQEIFPVEKISENMPPVCPRLAEASCNTETTVEACRIVPQLPAVHKTLLKASSKDNEADTKYTHPSAPGNGGIQSLHKNKPFTNSRTRDCKGTTRPKEGLLTSKKPPESQVKTKSGMQKRQAEQVSPQQYKRDDHTVATLDRTTRVKYQIPPPEEAGKPEKAATAERSPWLPSGKPKDWKPPRRDTAGVSEVAKYTAQSYSDNDIALKQPFKPVVVRASDTFKRYT